jgi:hypothetical protein
LPVLQAYLTQTATWASPARRSRLAANLQSARPIRRLQLAWISMHSHAAPGSRILALRSRKNMVARQRTCRQEAVMPPFDEYRRQRTMLLTTRKRDGTTVGTPVNVAVGWDGRAYFRTWSETGKVKRMRNYPQVWIAPCPPAARPPVPSNRRPHCHFPDPKLPRRLRRSPRNTRYCKGSWFRLFTASPRRPPSTMSFCPPRLRERPLGNQPTERTRAGRRRTIRTCRWQRATLGTNLPDSRIVGGILIVAMPTSCIAALVSSRCRL